MKSLDLYNKLGGGRAISPVSVADNTAQVSQIIDRQGFSGLMFAINARRDRRRRCDLRRARRARRRRCLADAAAVPTPT
jgi:hypothetical protein